MDIYWAPGIVFSIENTDTNNASTVPDLVKHTFKLKRKTRIAILNVHVPKNRIAKYVKVKS